MTDNKLNNSKIMDEEGDDMVITIKKGPSDVVVIASLLEVLASEEQKKEMREILAKFADISLEEVDSQIVGVGSSKSAPITLADLNSPKV